MQARTFRDIGSFDGAVRQLRAYFETLSASCRPGGCRAREQCVNSMSWQPAGRDAYDVVTEFRVKDRWVPGFKVHMEKATPVKLKEPKR